MIKHNTLNKISNFVQEQIDLTKRSVVIVETANGYKVNDFKIQQINNLWHIFNNKNMLIGTYRNKRLAVLIAALKVKKRDNLVHEVDVLDLSLFTKKQDKLFFEFRINHNFKKEMFEDRLSRTMFDLTQIYSKISELEKSVGLQ